MIPVHPWIHFLSQARDSVPHLLLGLLLQPVGQGSPSERLQLPSLFTGGPSILGMHKTNVFLVCSILFFAQPFFGLKGMGGVPLFHNQSHPFGGRRPLDEGSPPLLVPMELVVLHASPGLAIPGWLWSQG